MIKIVIKTENAAFEDDNRGPEVARILREIADSLAEGLDVEDLPPLRDLNGNVVGHVTEK